jgi:site-specific recombinase XerD
MDAAEGGERMSGVYPLDPWLEGYLSYLTEVRRQAVGTVRDVRCTLHRVGQALARHRPGVPLWRLDLQDYLHWIEEARQQGQSPKYLAKHLSHLRGLLDYAWRSGRADRNVLDGFQLQDGRACEVPSFLTIEQARQLVTACPAGNATERAERTAILLLYGCGLRTSELCNLNVQDVHRERREVFVERGKGSRQRYIPIPEAVFMEVLAYLLERGGKRGPLFRTGIKQCRVSPKWVGEVVRRAAQRAGLNGTVTPKTLRHSYATHLMDRGVDLAVISALMGHRSPSETGIYLHVLPGRPQEAIGQLGGLGPQGDQ